MGAPSGNVDQPEPKIGKGMNEANIQGQSPGVQLKRTQNGQGQPKNDFQGGKTEVVQVECGYCGKPNHTEYECWRKAGKCLHYGSTAHRMSSCPTLPQRRKMTQQSDKSGPIEAGRARAPARIYTMEGMSTSENSEDEIFFKGRRM